MGVFSTFFSSKALERPLYHIVLKHPILCIRVHVFLVRMHFVSSTWTRIPKVIHGRQSLDVFMRKPRQYCTCTLGLFQLSWILTAITLALVLIVASQYRIPKTRVLRIKRVKKLSISYELWWCGITTNKLTHSAILINPTGHEGYLICTNRGVHWGYLG